VGHGAGNFEKRLWRKDSESLAGVEWRSKVSAIGSAARVATPNRRELVDRRVFGAATVRVR
jgi:hypothetical protein